MDSITKGILMVEGIIFLGLIAALVYLIIKRLEDKSSETFEKRDN